jgi:hypothetical protein
MATTAMSLGDVEIGQLAIVALFLPIAFALRVTWTYRHLLMAGGSAGIARSPACGSSSVRSICLFLWQSLAKSRAKSRSLSLRRFLPLSARLCCLNRLRWLGRHDVAI